jgi:hypothetical protein
MCLMNTCEVKNEIAFFKQQVLFWFQPLNKEAIVSSKHQISDYSPRIRLKAGNISAALSCINSS